MKLPRIFHSSAFWRGFIDGLALGPLRRWFLGKTPATVFNSPQPGDILEWRCPRFSHVSARWKVIGCHYGALGVESLIEMESLTHEMGWTGEWEYHPRVFVPEQLTRGLKIIRNGSPS